MVGDKDSIALGALLLLPHAVEVIGIVLDGDGDVVSGELVMATDLPRSLRGEVLVRVDAEFGDVGLHHGV